MGLEVEVIGESNKFDVIVIGGGVAGMTASSLVTQSGLKACFLEKDVPGGKLMHIAALHNYPQNPGISGKDFALSIFKQATEEVKTKYIYGDVQTIKPKNGMFYLFTADGQTWETKAIIIAIGTINKKLHVDGEDKFYNNGLSYCVLCDASFAQGKNAVLIGSKESFDTLSSYAKSVTVLKAEEVKSINGDTYITGITKTDGSQINCDCVFIENGYEPNTSLLPSDIELDENQLVIVDESMASPYLEGVFACGDCINSKTKQVAPAMQQAATAALSAVKYVKSKTW